MRNSAIAVLVFLPAVTFVSWTHAADAPALPSTPALSASASATTSPAAPTVTPPVPSMGLPLPTLPAASPRPVAACLLGAHPSIDDALARSTAAVICDELRRYGVAIGPLVSSAGDADIVHRIDLEPIGRVVMVRVTHEQPAGTFRAMRRVVVGSLEEVIVVAPAIADATVRGLAFDDTSRARRVSPPRPRDEPYDRATTTTTHFGLGVVGYALPAARSYSGLGVDVPFYVETFRWGAGISFRYADLGGDHDGHFYALSSGARWFPVTSSATPVLGGGLAVSSVRWRDNPGAGTFYGEGSGAGAFLEAGFEALRDVRAFRLQAGLRLDLPFYSLNSKGLTYLAGPPSSTGGPPTPGRYVPSPDTKYVVPITLNATLYFL